MSKTPTASVNPAHSQPSPSADGGAKIGLKSGSKLGKYEIIGRLGLGGMAMVYKGYDPLLDRFVAIKQIASHLAADPKFMERFRKEAQILAKLAAEQANVVQIYELIEDGRGLFIIMEFVEGQTLDVLIERHNAPLPVQTALQVIWHLAVALRAVHANKVIHRDIKPANVLVGVNNRCKITDFGVAAHLGGKTSMTLGTTKYMAPELFSGEEVDGRVDVYSLGCIAYEMLCGQQKFNEIFRDIVRDERAESLRWMKWHTSPELMAPMLNQVNPQVPEILAKIVAKMMAKNPEQRFTSAEHVLEILKRHFTQGGQVIKRPAGGQGQARPASAGAAAGAAVPGRTAGTPASPGPAEADVRRPEPIPDRTAAAKTPAPAPAASVESGGPKTTRLPRRKMTRKQRLIVLSSFLGVLLLTLLGLQIHRTVKHNRLEARGKAIFEQAMDQMQAGQIAQARQTMLRLNTPPDREGQLQEQLVKLHDELIRHFEGTPERQQVQGQIDQVQSELQQVRLDLQLASTQAAGWVAPTLLWLDAHEALKARDWARAEAVEKQLRQSGFDRDKLQKFSKEWRLEKFYEDKVAEANAQMEQAVAEMNQMLFSKAAKSLEEAQEAKPGQSMEAEFDKLATRRVDYEYKLALSKATAAMQAGRPDEAEKAYLAAQGVRDTAEVQAALRQIDQDRRYDQLMQQAIRAKDASNTVEMRRALEAANRLRPSADLASQIAHAKGFDLYAQGKRALERNDEKTAEDLFRQAQALHPGLEPYIKVEMDKLKNKNEFASLVRSGDQALNSGDFEQARNLYGQAMRIGQAQQLDAAKALPDKIRQASYREKTKKADEAVTQRKWGEAERYLREARNMVRSDDAGTIARIDRRIQELQRDRNYFARMDSGENLFSKGQFVEALEQFKAARLIYVEARVDTKDVDGRIRDTNYARFLHAGRVDMERRMWTNALGWLNMAQKEKSTPEVAELIDQVRARIAEQERPQS